MNITIVGWFIVVMSLTAGVCFIFSEQYYYSPILLLGGVLLGYIGIKDKLVEEAVGEENQR